VEEKAHLSGTTTLLIFPTYTSFKFSYAVRVGGGGEKKNRGPNLRFSLTESLRIQGTSLARKERKTKTTPIVRRNPSCDHEGGGLPSAIGKGKKEGKRGDKRGFSIRATAIAYSLLKEKGGEEGGVHKKKYGRYPTCRRPAHLAMRKPDLPRSRGADAGGKKKKKKGGKD